MNHGTRAYLLIGVAVLGAALLLSGTTGSWLFLLWPLACMGMMVAMMWGMGRSGPRKKSLTEHTHEDGSTHAHS